MLASIIINFTSKFTETIDQKIKADKETNEKKEPFKLPIHYLDQTDIYTLNETVASDLELFSDALTDTSNVNVNVNKTMYHYLLKPENQFALNTIPMWSESFTTNTHFLGETQQIIRSMDMYKYRLKTAANDSGYAPDYDKIMEIWRDTKDDSSFLERYSYMELEMFKSLNKMPSFLQAISVVNMGSPILSFLIPFMLFIITFFILKIQGIPISFSMYISVLKEVSKNHFIGKMLSNAENMSLQNALYIIILIGLYAYQIYQNYISCMRFYKNISRINKQICDMQEYLDYTVSSMESFAMVIQDKIYYRRFSMDLIKHLENLRELRAQLSPVCPFTPSFSKIGEIGILLGCYYELHSNLEYEESLKYSFCFEGYICNLLGIYENVGAGRVAFGEFYHGSDSDSTDGSGNSLQMKDQYYPALIHTDYIVNDVDMDKNIIITGPNAAGKTTYLKTATLNVIFTQQFGVGFYSACKMQPYTHIHSYLNIPDTSGRDSLFQAESRRCKDIIDVIVSNNDTQVDRHFCIFDELYSGTNPTEASKSAYSFLYYLAKFENVDFILTTHYVDICDRLNKPDIRIDNWKMDAEISADTGDIEYKYTISRGISHIQGAIKVLRDMNYPEEIIQNIILYDTVLSSGVNDAVTPDNLLVEEIADTVVEEEKEEVVPIIEDPPKIPKKKGRKPKNKL